MISKHHLFLLALALLHQTQAAVLPLQKLLIQEIDQQNALGRQDLASQGFRLIQTSPTVATWMTEEEILGLKQKEVGYMDITSQDLEAVNSLALPKRFAPPSKVGHKDIVVPLFEKISIPGMQAFLDHFTSFRTRYYQSASGSQSADWLFEKIQAIQPKNPQKVSVKVTRFLHEWGQFSIIARVESRNNASQNENDIPIVIVGSHQDSANGANPYFGRAPGADDDGSGTVTTLEAYRVLLESGFVPGRPVEFHWYSAEEAGLLGSQKVAAEYKRDGKQVAGMYQVDMTGYVPKGKTPQVAIITDFTDPDLSDFARKLVSADHASWTKAGYSSIFTFEGEFKDHSPFIHTVEDTVENIDFGHVVHFVRVVLGFVVEMSLV
ncbi:hypothetical protein BDR26DRAFT_909595 [Obelidium mucronatum]|nr:hypothetical protein BDR26DRAFT_909595 [Obelidium mucronatum]